MPITDGGGRVIGHIALVDDKPMRGDVLVQPIFQIFSVRAGGEIERMWVEDSLHAERRMKHSVLGQIAEAVITVDADGTIREMNAAAEQLTGWPVADALGRPTEEILQVLDPDTGTAMPSALEHCLARFGEYVSQSNAVLLTRDGRRVPVCQAAAPIPGRDQAVGGAVLLFDRLDRFSPPAAELLPAPIHQIDASADHRG